MTSAVKSYQQLDPIGGYGIRPVTLLGAVLAFAYAVGATAFDWGSITMPPLAVAALLACGAASLGMAFWSSPLRAPFPTLGFVVVIGLDVLAMVLAVAATWGGPALGSAEWGPVALGLVIMQLGPYRPARQLVTTTLIATAGAVAIAVPRPGGGAAGRPLLVVIVETAVPLLAFGLASTTYAAALGHTIEGWRSTAALVTRAATEELRDGIVQSVQHDRVTILNLQVVPFFANLLERGRVAADDPGRAALIADSIRSLMVADVDRSWLDAVIDQGGRARAVGPVPGSEMVQDGERLAGGMTTEQRTATRAFLVALFDHPGFDPDGFGIVLAREGARCAFTLTAKLDEDDSISRSGLAAYFAVLRIIFSDLQFTFQAPTLTLRFSYEHK